MPLTAAQSITFGLDIRANLDPIVVAALAASDLSTIAGWYNGDAIPNFWVYRTQLDKHVVYGQSGVDVDGVTPTNWNWTLFSGLTTPEQGAWIEMFNETGVQNPSLPNVRAAWADIFKGPQADPTAQRAHLAAMARRLANYVEKLFATGTGTAADPAAMVVEGSVNVQDVRMALEATAP